jgi:hypothetical protein
MNDSDDDEDEDEDEDEPRRGRRLTTRPDGDTDVDDT